MPASISSHGNYWLPAPFSSSSLAIDRFTSSRFSRRSSMPAGGSGRGLSMNACVTIGGRPMLTFYELVVVVLQSRALLSHVCCSTCTQGCMGWAAAVVIAFVGPGVSQLLVRTHAGWHRAVLVCFDAQPTAANPEFLPRPRARRPAGCCAPDAAAEQKSQKKRCSEFNTPGDQLPLCVPHKLPKWPASKTSDWRSRHSTSRD